MGNACGPQIVHCGNICDDKDSLAHSLDADLLTERGSNIVQMYVAGHGEGARPELPRLMLRTPRTSAEELHKEQAAMAKVVALPHDVSSSTEWSMTPLQRNTSRRSTKGFGLASLVEEPDKDIDKAPFVEIVFDDRGRKVTSQIYKRPLGAEFCSRSPAGLKVSKVFPESYAWGLGLEVGWAVMSIDGQSVSNSTFVESQTRLKECLQRLPTHVEVA
mmetsp:Transcript_83496/g.131964  ORF Transcript_83496/g.131964 Transcript_83496/m.131964 type:complete len:217 (-) Transcript_83496:213-863(-)|eukprot:CAMPEP_0169128334 /NCGR_PEP_ID=MMETSP1015-20121227/36509_1 /TAXON_ID=342587 /ORGANISM="Karlodinium micrum, Strain CCMP2283" /LENGTH=216 /DNA_ID=CAMNT_0009192223 /DNA_START=38 /DNA_END=688 /DNA_ORIENTATION=-